MNILQKTLITKTTISNIIFPSISLRLNQFFLSTFYSTWSTKFHSNDPQLQVISPVKEIEQNPTSVDGFGKKKWSKPAEIPFQVKVANWVNFVGIIRMPIQFCTSLDGKSWAGTVIYPQRHPFSALSSMWVPIIFEGDLAHTAASHLKENEQVYVAGHFSPDLLPINLTNDQVKLQVTQHPTKLVFVGTSSQASVWRETVLKSDENILKQQNLLPY